MSAIKRLRSGLPAMMLVACADPTGPFDTPPPHLALVEASPSESPAIFTVPDSVDLNENFNVQFTTFQNRFCEAEGETRVVVNFRTVEITPFTTFIRE
ncbi:MAG: hypothetical protein MJB57_12460, partial [Gemmatimonadetes bacterium]|nr:hypothetical protein [Gemmatimonadota bacterium]